MKSDICRLEVVNINTKQDESYDVGGNWACVIGCGSFCLMGGGSVSVFAAVATAL